MADWAKNTIQIDGEETPKEAVTEFFSSISNKVVLPDEEIELLIDFQKIIPVEIDDFDPNWRDVCWEAWGTKGVYYFDQHQIDELTIEFLTAWTGVPRLMKELSHQHPKVKFCYVCELGQSFEGLNSIGTFVFKAGETLVDACYRDGTESYEKFMGLLYKREREERARKTKEPTKTYPGYVPRFVKSSDECEKDERIFEELAQKCTTPLDVTLEELNLTIRPFNCLKRASINTVGDIVSRTREELLQVRNFRQKCLDEVELKLSKLGVTLA